MKKHLRDIHGKDVFKRTYNKKTKAYDTGATHALDSCSNDDNVSYDLRKTVGRVSMAAALQFSHDSNAHGNQNFSWKQHGKDFSARNKMLLQMDEKHVTEDDWQSSSDSEAEVPQPAQTKKAKRTKKEKHEKPSSSNRASYLWRLIWRLLDSPMFCPRAVRWVNKKNKEFQIVDKEMLARVWAVERGHSSDTVSLGVLNRCFKNACRNKHMVCISGTRYVFRFGPNATKPV
ncbi:ETS-related transcription factor Elf-1-like isoform X2 [Paramacrobiotus metropolitanus]|uniref:ETS-related transcription factor Elf-1-like isoform X2 n=1 Tax=Paramacrobiotus metropolitanus TaxID=2943436 RepID=UPI0024458BF5|nr:ETS-related transcription factor Elf-1-like isoform X2 [Paramacrobiotus metropolitanus]